jgi:hypothetical protein
LGLPIQSISQGNFKDHRHAHGLTVSVVAELRKKLFYGGVFGCDVAVDFVAVGMVVSPCFPRPMAVGLRPAASRGSQAILKSRLRQSWPPRDLCRIDPELVVARMRGILILAGRLKPSRRGKRCIGRPLRFARDQPLIRQQRGDFPRD